MKRLGITTIIAMAMLVSCTPKVPAPVPTDLDGMLRNARQDDIVITGSHIDEIRYAYNGLVVWYRHFTRSATQPYPVVGHGMHLAAIYVFDDSKLLGAIPVDVTLQPFLPTVYPFEEHSVLIGSYQFKDNTDPRREGEKRDDYVVNWYLVDRGLCKSVLQVSFEGLNYPTDRSLSFTTFVPYGRDFIAEMAWEGQIGDATGKVKASLVAVYRWDAAAKRFVRGSTAPTTVPAGR